MEIVWMIMALTLSVCLLPAIAWVWWRIRRLERLVRRRLHEQEEQLSLLLHELVEELEQRGNALLDQIERREDRFRVLLDQVKLMELYMKTHLTAPHEAKAEEPDEPADLKRQARESSSVAWGPEAATAEKHTTSDSTIERQIQDLLRQGLSPQLIAQRLQVGVGEVEVTRNLNFWREGQTNRRSNTHPNGKK